MAFQRKSEDDHQLIFGVSRYGQNSRNCDSTYRMQSHSGYEHTTHNGHSSTNFCEKCKRLLWAHVVSVRLCVIRNTKKVERGVILSFALFLLFVLAAVVENILNPGYYQ